MAPRRFHKSLILRANSQIERAGAGGADAGLRPRSKGEGDVIAAVRDHAAIEILHEINVLEQILGG